MWAQSLTYNPGQSLFLSGPQFPGLENRLSNRPTSQTCEDSRRCCLQGGVSAVQLNTQQTGSHDLCVPPRPLTQRSAMVWGLGRLVLKVGSSQLELEHVEATPHCGIPSLGLSLPICV